MSDRPLCWVGFDTSNYTTSVSVVAEQAAPGRDVPDDADVPTVVSNFKKLLPVAPGGRGLRQSDAVFAHVKNLPELLEQTRRVLADGGYRVAAVGYSARPRDAVDSYMPCFLEGGIAARAFAVGLNVPLYAFSHQSGHITAALYGAGRLRGRRFLPDDSFLAFHVSGGTTEVVRVTRKTDGEPPEAEDDRVIPLDGGFSVDLVGGSADLHAGQVIDRAGVMMGLSFPCGPALEALAVTNQKKLPPMRLSVRDGVCNLSGVENQAQKLWRETGDAPLVAAFVLTFVGRTLRRITEQIQERLTAGAGARLPVLYAGGVMSNQMIRPMLSDGAGWGTFFAPPTYAADNAAGVALLCADQWRARNE